MISLFIPLILICYFLDGFCVAETKNVRIFKNVFLQIYSPYALKLREQANIRISVFNYNSHNITVSQK